MIFDSRQYALTVIPRTFNGSIVQQRATDGYINATAMCQAAGRQFNDYSILPTSEDFFAELTSETGIPVSELIQSLEDGDPHLQGTWVHPYVAVNLAQWASARFSVQVTLWVHEWMSGLGSPASTRRSTPMFVQRFNDNWDRVETGYFSVINELFIRIYGRLERPGMSSPIGR